MVTLTVPSAARDEGYGPGAGQDAADRDEQPRPAHSRRPDGEWQRKREHGDEITGHRSGIGAGLREREPVRGAP
jgi:hypothetical protein